VVGYGNKKNLEIMSKAKKIYLDGTFKCVPQIFTQMITIHAKYEGRIWPLIHVLLNNKLQDSYKLMLSAIKRVMLKHKLSWKPESFSVDFEAGMIVALELHYPNAQIFGCYYHYCQAVYRKVQELGLAKAFTSNIVVNNL